MIPIAHSKIAPEPKKTRAHRPFLGFVSFLFCALVEAQSDYVHDSWTVEDGLPVNSVTEIVQSRSGYLWLSTFDGLVRFDGARFSSFSSSNTPGFVQNRLASVRESSDGKLLLGSEAGVLQLFDPEQQTSQVLKTAAGRNSMKSWSAPDGRIFISLKPGLGLLLGETIVALPIAGMEKLQVTALGFGQQKLWIGTENSGVWGLPFATLDMPVRTDQTALAQASANALVQRITAQQLPIGTINALSEDDNGRLWIGGQRGVMIAQANRLTTLRNGAQPWTAATRWLHRDANGAMLMGSEAGLYRVADGQLQALDGTDSRRPPAQAQALDAQENWWVSASAVFKDGAQLLRFSDVEGTRITRALRDRQGALWLATSGDGLHRLRPALISGLSKAQGLSAREVYPLHQSPDGTVWIGTLKGGLNSYTQGKFSHYGSAHGLLDNNIRAIASDAAGNLWVATQEAGLFKRTGARFVQEPDRALIGIRIKALFLDRAGTLWAGADSGLWHLDRLGEWQRHPASEALAGCTVRVIREDPKGTAYQALWLGTHRCGVARLAGESLKRYASGDGELSDFVRDIFVIDARSLWIASEDRGLTRLKIGEAAEVLTATPVRASDGLLSDGIHQIVADGLGWLWMSTNTGLFRVRQTELDTFADSVEQRSGTDLNAKLPIESYAEAAGMRNREANGGYHLTALRSKSGQLWFATQDGVAIVRPDSALLARPVKPQIESVVSAAQVWRTDAPVTLPAAARSFHIEYTELLQLDPPQVHFRYRLNGFDDDWIDVNTRRSAYYTKVPPGNYQFQLQAWAGGDWNGPIASLDLNVRPFFYETGWFKALLALLAVGLMALVYRARFRRLNRQRQELSDQVDLRTAQLAARTQAVEQASAVIAEQAEQLRELDRQKSRFFDDLAHELRTPLTLILGPLKDSQRDPKSAAQPAIDSAIRNGEVLLDLTNQLLDLARLESGQFHLDLHSEDLVALMRGCAERFAPLAKLRLIGFCWTAPASPLLVALDLRHAVKIFDNLLSNAFKFTPSGGQVELTVAIDAPGAEGVGQMVRIEIADTGPGIGAQHLPHVFDRFYQAESAGARLQPGTGIGLALVRDLTQLHGGRLAVQSELGAGSRFVVWLPLAEPASASDSRTLALVALPAVGPETAFEADFEDRTTVLVVDDHAELRAHLRTVLAPHYRVIEAADGLAALALARAQLPDLIVADVSMPELDGYALCAAVRADPDIDWLPIVLLTARSGMDHRLEGLRSAADDYLTKPFDSVELLTRIDNLIASRHRLKLRYAQMADADAAAHANPAPLAATSTGAIESSDAKFRARLMAAISARLSDEQFKVSDLADTMRQDRSQLFRRVREITGLAPSDLIRDLRLQRGATLLEANAGSISEVAAGAGFSSVAYFTKCFRERYGRTPGQHRAEPAKSAIQPN